VSWKRAARQGRSRTAGRCSGMTPIRASGASSRPMSSCSAWASFAGAPVRRGERADPLTVHDRTRRGAHATALSDRAKPAFFDCAPLGVAFADGYLRLDADGRATMHDHSPENRATVALPFARQEDAVCPLWDDACRLLVRTGARPRPVHRGAVGVCRRVPVRPSDSLRAGAVVDRGGSQREEPTPRRPSARSSSPWESPALHPMTSPAKPSAPRWPRSGRTSSRRPTSGS
jgi:hypothetical protein